MLTADSYHKLDVSFLIHSDVIAYVTRSHETPKQGFLSRSSHKGWWWVEYVLQSMPLFSVCSQSALSASSEALATVTGIVDGTGSVGAAIGQVQIALQCFYQYLNKFLQTVGHFDFCFEHDSIIYTVIMTLQVSSKMWTDYSFFVQWKEK